MTEIATRSVIIEREFAHPPGKLWRALTQPHLIEEWLMKNDFAPRLDHRFKLRFDWGAVHCEVREVDEHRRLSYTWNSGELESVVTWTLTPTPTGTLLRMEQSGFATGLAARYYQGAKAGWPKFFDGIERTLGRMTHP